MRQTRRLSVVVPTLSRDGRGTLTALEHRRRWRMEGRAPRSFPAYWNNPDVRGMLYATHGRACVYCSCHLPRNDRGDEEHFRPKGGVEEDPSHEGYWWLAYSLQNYLLACSLCNRYCKRKKFPLVTGAARVRFPDRRHLADEARLLLNPLLDPVEEYLEVVWKDSARCLIRPRVNLPDRENQMARTTLELFRINKDPRLVRERRDVRDKVLTALHEGREDDAREMAVRYRAHSLVARQVLESLRPSLLPTPREELHWLLCELTRELIQVLQVLEDFPADPFPRREANELLWALAVLWKSPPTGTSEEIESFLVREQLDSYVRIKLDDLRLLR